jgi:acyl-CoA thioesterase I
MGRRIAAVCAIAACVLNACTAQMTASPSAMEDAVRYVALGDSYTIGTSVTVDERWPNQLVARVAEDGVALELVENLGVNGYTSADLIRDELPRLNELDPEFITLLIGVNDVVQGVPENAYVENVATILDELLGHVAANRIVCLATPDYTVTPQGASYGDPEAQSVAIERANVRLSEECEARGIAFIGEIFELSRGAADDQSLVSDDGLHPSGVQYSQWVDVALPVVRRLIAG